MEQLILVVHLVVALTIIGLILLQRGKGADVGASFGGGASQTVFGSSGGGNVLTSATGWLSAIFFVTSFGLAMIADQRFSSDEDDYIGSEVSVESSAPAVLESDIPVLEEESDSDLPSDLPID